MKKVFDKDKINLPNKNIYALDDYFYPITKSEEELINIEYKVSNKKKYKNNEHVGYALIKIGNNTIHEEKLYVKVRKDNKKVNKNWFTKLIDKIF